MKRTFVVTAMVLSASMLTSGAMFAAPLAAHTPTHAKYSGEKVVKFSFRNATQAPIKVKAGDAEVTLPPGEVVPIKLPVGAKVVVQEASTHYSEGAILAVATTGINGETFVLN
ncbi:MAG: hypothetical protein WB439_10330 [Acidobacteriaceae bacterium]